MDSNVFKTGLEIGEFNLKEFLARFLCGGSSLREAKSVTNRRLILSRCGLDSSDFQAIALDKEISSFKAARQLVVEADNLDIELIKQVNRTACPNVENAGSIRTNQNCVKNSKDKVTYLPPAPEALATLIARLENDLHSLLNQDLVMFRDIYVQIQLIHLFSDGNGRTARAIYDGLLERLSCYQINPSYFRLGRLQDDYFIFLKSYNLKTREFLQPDYWDKAVKWCDEYTSKAKQVLSECNSKLTAKIGMSNFKTSHKNLLNLLWKQPVITPQLLCKQEDIPITECLNLISHFVTLGLLIPQKAKSLNGALVYCNEDILSSMDECERLLFEGKE